MYYRNYTKVCLRKSKKVWGESISVRLLISICCDNHHLIPLSLGLQVLVLPRHLYKRFYIVKLSSISILVVLSPELSILHEIINFLKIQISLKRNVKSIHIKDHMILTILYVICNIGPKHNKLDIEFGDIWLDYDSWTIHNRGLYLLIPSLYKH